MELFAVTIKSSTHRQCVTNFVFLQFSVPRSWYSLLNKHSMYVAVPKGKTSLQTADV